MDKNIKDIKEIALIDFSLLGPSGGGHSETYFLKILSTLIHENYFVYACCANNERLREKVRQNNLDKTCRIIDFKPKLLDKVFYRLLKLLDIIVSNLFQIKYIEFASLYKLIATKSLIQSINHKIPVFFAHLDSVLPAVPIKVSRLFMPNRWTGLYISPSFKSKEHFESRSNFYRIKKFYKEKSLSVSSCRSVLVLHPIYKRFLNKHTKINNCVHLPELIEIPSLLDSKLNKHESQNQINHVLLEKIKEEAKGRTIISFLGNITFKKNFPLFLKSVSLLDPNQYFILVLGRLKGQNKSDFLPDLEIIENRNMNSHIDLNYYISNEIEFSDLISLSNIIFLHYRDHPYSSNVLSKAMAHRKPVIVNKVYLMEKIVKEYNWRDVVESDPRKIAQSIQELSDPKFKIQEDSYQLFLKNHSPEVFEKSIIKAANSLYE